MFKTDKGVIIIIYGSIICLGDSLTAGSRDELWRGYPVELELLLWKYYPKKPICDAAVEKAKQWMDRLYGKESR